MLVRFSPSNSVSVCQEHLEYCVLQVGNNQFEDVIKDISPSGLQDWHVTFHS